MTATGPSRVELTDPTRGSSEPGRCWTQSNISEACPEVMSPLCSSVWLMGSRFSTRQALCDLGLLAKHEVKVDADPNKLPTACFYGRQAVNVDVLREIIARAPGGSPDDFERDALGYVRADAPAIKTSHRHFAVATKMPIAAIRQWRQIKPLHDEQLHWWQAEVLAENPTLTGRELLRDAAQRFQRAVRLHAYSRLALLPALQVKLNALADAAHSPDLTITLLGGLGGTLEAEIAFDLWEVSRGHIDRAEFIRRHGYHGPAMGNPIAPSWREDQRPIDALVKAYTRLDDGETPRNRERAASTAHQRAAATLLTRLPWQRRAEARILLKTLRAQVRHLGLGKAAFGMAIDGIRAAARRIGTDLAAQGHVSDPGDAFFLTLEELLAPVPGNLSELIAFRRDRRTEYQNLTLPTTWIGMPEPVALLDDQEAPIQATVKGCGGSAGIATGRARVIRHPDDADDVEPGEILVCRSTDPSWATIFPLVGAVVIDIGGMASHGAVVSRELGIPCVIGTDNGSKTIRTGDLLTVDGTSGTVSISHRI